MTTSPWPHFSSRELGCRCGCGAGIMDPQFMTAIERIRRRYGRPMLVSSAYRCPAHNILVSSSGRDGPHVLGLAIDILVDGPDALYLLRLALEAGLTGLGIAQRGPRRQRFLHLDMLPHSDVPPVRPYIWSY